MFKLFASVRLVAAIVEWLRAYPLLAFALVTAAFGVLLALVARTMRDRDKVLESAVDDEPEFRDAFARDQRRARRTTLVWISAIALTVYGFMAYAILGTDTQTRMVLVTVRAPAPEGESPFAWEGNGASVAITNQIHTLIGDVGLETPKFDDVTLRLLSGYGDDVESAAGHLGAAHIVYVDLEPGASSQHPWSARQDQWWEVHVEIDPVGTDAEPVAFEAGEILTWGEGTADGLRRGAGKIAERVHVGLVLQLAKLPAFARLRDLDAVRGVQDREDANALEPLFRRASTLEEKLTEQVTTAADPKPAAAVKRKRISEPLAEEYWMGWAGPTTMLVKEVRRILVPLPDKAGFGLRVGGEALAKVDLATGSRTPVIWTYNIYSSAGVSAAGPIAAVFDDHGQDKNLVVIEGENARRLAGPGGYFSSPEPSPDGTHVAFLWSPRRNDRYNLLVQPLGGTESKELLPGAPHGIGAPQWAPDSKAIFLLVDPGTGWGVHRVQLESGLVERLLPPPEGEQAQDGAQAPGVEADEPPEEPGAERPLTFDQFDLGGDGQFLFVRETASEGSFIGHYDLQAAAYRRVGPGFTDLVLAHPRLPIVATTDGEGRIVLLRAEGGDPILVTDRPPEEDFATWTPDGTGLVVHHGGTQEGTRRPLNRIFVYDVASLLPGDND